MYLLPLQEHNVAGQKKNLDKETGACALVYSGLPSSPSFTMHLLPPELLVSSIDTVLEVTHTPVHHRALDCQCDPGVPQGHQTAASSGKGELHRIVHTENR